MKYKVEKLAGFLRELRESLNMSRNDLRVRMLLEFNISLSINTIKNYEKGRTIPQLDVIYAYVEMFALAPDDIFLINN